MCEVSTIIRLSSLGLEAAEVFVAHENGNWGPESEGSDYLQHPLTLSSDGQLVCDVDFLLEPGEEFKIVVPGLTEAEAKEIYGLRVAAGEHVGTRFDYDANVRAAWYLASSHPVIRPGQWNQNNVFCLCRSY